MIRRMTEHDVSQVAPLAAGLVRDHFAFDSQRFMLPENIEEGYRWFLGTQLKKKNVVLLVAELEGVIVGYFYGSLEGKDWEMLLDAHGAVHDLFVAEAARRNGVAKTLLTAGIDALKAQGAPRIVLYSASENHRAQRLFETIGFRRTMVEMTLG